MNDLTDGASLTAFVATCRSVVLGAYHTRSVCDHIRCDPGHALAEQDTRSVCGPWATSFISGSDSESATSPTNLLQKGDLAGITAERGF